MFNHQEWERGNSKLQGGAHHRFMPQHVIFFYSINMDSFDELSICDKSVKRLLEILSLENSLSIEENVYANLVRIFYSNIENSSSRKMQILAKVGGVPIEFDVKDLNWILGTEDEGLKIYASRKELIFNHFLHVNEAKKICWRDDLSNDICHFPFCSQLLPYRFEYLTAFFSI